MNSWYHAKSCARKWGGEPEDYLLIHQFIDSSKQVIGDVRHRALYHHTLGVYLCERIFGVTITVRGKQIPVRLIAERHILEDLGWLPSPADYINGHADPHLDVGCPTQRTTAVPLTERRTPMTASFLGIQIEGDITRGDKKERQRPLSELEPLIRAVLDDELIHSFGWDQYTPYFNDGDPCTFDVNDLWFKTVHDAKPKSSDEDEDDFDDDDHGVMYGTHPTLGRRDYSWNNTPGGERLKVWRDYEGEHEQTWQRCYDLAEAVGTGAFDDVLLEAFGDHAKVEVTRDGIKVDFYEHD